jgi:transcriptional regulator with XRE-family HTH domain/mannose-6-phosphate isomerase-like protein (cupin superfamily)
LKARAEIEPVDEQQLQDPSARNGVEPEAIGRLLREERLRQEIGVRELARRVRVSPSLVSQVELGKASPSVGTLYAIVSELGLSLDELMLGQSRRRPGPDPSGPGKGYGAPSRPDADAGPADEAPPGAFDPVVRTGRGKTIHLDSGVQWERLTPQTPQIVDFFKVVYEVGSESCPEDSLMRHSGSEYGHVLSGRLCVTIGFDTYDLGPGDSISFDSTMPHRLFNVGRERVDAIWFVMGRRGDPRVARNQND